MIELRMTERIQGTNPETGRLKYARGTGEVVRFEETGHHGTVAVVRWTNGVETYHPRNLDNSNVEGLDVEFAAYDAVARGTDTSRVPLHEQPMPGSPAAVARAEEDDPTGDIAAPDDLGQRDPNEGIDEWHAFMDEMTSQDDEQLTREEMRDLWDADDTRERRAADHNYANTVGAFKCENGERLCRQHTATMHAAGAVDSEFVAQVDALVARELSADPVPADLVERVQFASKMWTRTTDIPTRDAVVVQFGSKLVWGKLINVVNRDTRYSAPLLATVELESGVRQLVAADDVLVA